ELAGDGERRFLGLLERLRQALGDQRTAVAARSVGTAYEDGGEAAEDADPAHAGAAADAGAGAGREAGGGAVRGGERIPALGLDQRWRQELADERARPEHDADLDAERGGQVRGLRRRQRRHAEGDGEQRRGERGSGA